MKPEVLKYLEDIKLSIQAIENTFPICHRWKNMKGT